MKSSFYFLSLAVLLPLGACSGSKSKDDGPNPLATVSGFCQAWAEVACNPDVVELCGGGEDVVACQQTQFDFCEELVPSVGYDPKYAKECLRAVEVAYTGDGLDAEQLLLVRQLGGDCSRLTRGSAEEGESCDADTDCDTIEGFVCVKRPGGDGTCQIPEEVGAGKSCRDPAAVCEEGFYCDGRNCIEKLPEDEPCVDTQECADDLRCAQTSAGEGGASGDDSDGAGTCVPRITGIDTTCSVNDDCKSGYCEQSGSAAGECVSSLKFSRRDPVCEDLR